jgi:hypothetical protein
MTDSLARTPWDSHRPKMPAKNNVYVEFPQPIHKYTPPRYTLKI